MNVSENVWYFYKLLYDFPITKRLIRNNSKAISCRNEEREHEYSSRSRDECTLRHVYLTLTITIKVIAYDDPYDDLGITK